MKITDHFDSSEFLCRHCGKAGILTATVEALEKLRVFLGKPIKVRSGYRCRFHPLEARKPLPGTGRHCLGEAVDIAVEGMTARELYEAAEQFIQFNGIGVDDVEGYIHVDIRNVTKRALWCYRNGATIAWTNTPIQPDAPVRA